MYLFHFDKYIHKGVFYLIYDIIKYFEISSKQVSMKIMQQKAITEK